MSERLSYCITSDFEHDKTTTTTCSYFHCHCYHCCCQYHCHYYCHCSFSHCYAGLLPPAPPPPSCRHWASRPLGVPRRWVARPAAPPSEAAEALRCAE